MAIKAFAIPQNSATNSTNNARVDVNVKVNILGGDLGNYVYPEFDLLIENLNPTTVAAVDIALQAAIQAEMEANGIEFDVLDPVIIY